MGLRGEELLMALAEAEEVESGILGGLGVADEFVDALAGIDARSVVRVGQMIAEAVDAELQSLTSVEAELMHIVRLL